MKKWSVVLLALTAFVFVGLTGCENLLGEKEEDPKGTFVFNNMIGGPVYSVYISSYDGVYPTQDTKGVNHLAENETIANGAKKSFSLAPGSYEVAYTYFDSYDGKFYWIPLVYSKTTIYKFDVVDGQTTGATVNADNWDNYSASARGTVSPGYLLGDRTGE